eukprot:5568331-Pyramimonas_sp.AAC.1
MPHYGTITNYPPTLLELKNQHPDVHRITYEVNYFDLPPTENMVNQDLVRVLTHRLPAPSSPLPLDDDGGWQRK